MSRKLYALISLLVAIGMFLAACSPAAVTPAPTMPAQQQSAATPAPVAAAADNPTAAPKTSRSGAWVDSVVFTEENSAEAAVSKLNSGDLDLYAYSVAEAPVYQTVQSSPNLASSQLVGSSNEVMLNPAKFTSGSLNPFSDPQIGEAMNYLMDRDHIVQEIYKGLAIPKFSALTTVFPDYARYADLMRALEAKYAYNPEKAKAIVTERMQALGATLVADKWQFNGKPVKLIFIIRTEDNRKPIGDYFSNQLESIGFSVDRQYKTRSEASPIWNQSNPADGLWNLYTAGWISPTVARDEGINFSNYYSRRGSASPLWQAYGEGTEMDKVAQKLESNDFKDLSERRDLFDKALTLSLQSGYHIWCVDEASFSPRVASLSVASDLAGGAQGSQIWGQTLRLNGKDGGTVRIAQPGILVEPWNPIAGSNWIYDSMPQRGTGDNGVVADPFTGLAWPQRIEKADVTVQTGLPVSKTLDWVTLNTAPEIKVPADAWIDWDAKTQKFITVGEKFPNGLTAKVRSTVYYPADLTRTVKWQDGSPVSVADFVMGMIMYFDPAKKDSPIYDAAAAPATEGYQSHFKGVRIVTTDPLVIETYDDAFFLDAENIISNNAIYPNPTWWPYQSFGEGPWDTLGLGVLAETNKELAFSTDKAGNLKIEWLSFISGPSLDILKKYLDQATSQSYIPYAPTLGAFVTADEAAARYANLAKWYAEHNHFWVNTGPFYLDKVYPVEKTLTLKRNPDYADNADKWSGFGEPKISEATLSGDSAIKIGAPATFNVAVSFKGAPYPAAEISSVKYLLFNAKGELVSSGEAMGSGDGQYQVVLPGDLTSKLETGSNKLEVVVVSSVVSIPSFASLEFVTTQ
jgi:peptide/nickel transport system substrate-binding protein